MIRTSKNLTVGWLLCCILTLSLFIKCSHYFVWQSVGIDSSTGNRSYFVANMRSLLTFCSSFIIHICFESVVELVDS